MSTGNENPLGNPKVTALPNRIQIANPEFSHFRELTKKLVAVPKTEVDQKRKKV